MLNLNNIKYNKTDIMFLSVTSLFMYQFICGIHFYIAKTIFDYWLVKSKTKTLNNTWYEAYDIFEIKQNLLNYKDISIYVFTNFFLVFYLLHFILNVTS